MNKFKVPFDIMAWEEGRHGVRFKTYCDDARQIRLVEFLTSEGFDQWCNLGHIGYVLAGGLQIDFNGEVVSFGTGDGLFIPAGSTSAHRAVSIIPGTRLIMVEDI